VFSASALRFWRAPAERSGDGAIARLQAGKLLSSRAYAESKAAWRFVPAIVKQLTKNITALAEGTLD